MPRFDIYFMGERADARERAYVMPVAGFPSTYRQSPQYRGEQRVEVANIREAIEIARQQAPLVFARGRQVSR